MYKPFLTLLKNFYIRAAAAIGILLMHAAVWLLNRIEYRRALALGSRAGSVLYRLSSRMKARIRHNLQFALGDRLSAKERERITRQVMRSIAMNWFELFYYGGPNKGEVDAHVTFQGLENLDRALGRGTGVIAVSAHLSNYPILAQQFSRRGYPFVMVIREPASRVIAAMYEKGREMIELRSLLTMPERRFYRDALQILRNNGILCLIADENKRRGGIFVDFFGRPASTAPGPAALALRTGAPVVPIFLMRNPDNSLRVVIEREIALQPGADPQQALHDLTAAYTQVIEQQVRNNIAQWMWTNFRWRTQPWGRADEAKLKKKRPMKRLIRRLKQLG